MSIRTETDESTGASIFHVEGELSLATAGNLQTAVLHALRPGVRVVFDGAGLTSVDLAGLQLICSAHRTCVLSGAHFEFRAMRREFQEIAFAAGFDACTAACPYRRENECVWRR